MKIKKFFIATVPGCHGSGSRYLLYGILSDIRNAGKMLGKRAGNF